MCLKLATLFVVSSQAEPTTPPTPTPSPAAPPVRAADAEASANLWDYLSQSYNINFDQVSLKTKVGPQPQTFSCCVHLACTFAKSRVVLQNNRQTGGTERTAAVVAEADENSQPEAGIRQPVFDFSQLRPYMNGQNSIPRVELDPQQNAPLLIPPPSPPAPAPPTVFSYNPAPSPPFPPPSPPSPPDPPVPSQNADFSLAHNLFSGGGSQDSTAQQGMQFMGPQGFPGGIQPFGAPNMMGPMGGPMVGPMGGPMSGPMSGPMAGPMAGPMGGPLSGPMMMRPQGGFPMMFPNQGTMGGPNMFQQGPNTANRGPFPPNTQGFPGGTTPGLPFLHNPPTTTTAAPPPFFPPAPVPSPPFSPNMPPVVPALFPVPAPVSPSSNLLSQMYPTHGNQNSMNSPFLNRPIVNPAVDSLAAGHMVREPKRFPQC